MNSVNLSDKLFFIMMLMMFMYSLAFTVVNQKVIAKGKTHPAFKKNVLKSLTLSLIPIIFYVSLIFLFFIKFINFLAIYGGNGISSYVVTGITCLYFTYFAWKYCYYKISLYLLKREI